MNAVRKIEFKSLFTKFGEPTLLLQTKLPCPPWGFPKNPARSALLSPALKRGSSARHFSTPFNAVVSSINCRYFIINWISWGLYFISSKYFFAVKFFTVPLPLASSPTKDFKRFFTISDEYLEHDSEKVFSKLFIYENGLCESDC